MAISYPISLPAVGTVSVAITQKSAVAITQSPYTFEQQVQALAGQTWQLTLNYPAQKRSVMEPLIAAFVSLNGREGTFLLGDPANKTPRGTATGTPLVNGASQTGYDLITDGWTNSITGILKAGDWLQLGTGSTARLYKVMADANSNGSGQSTITLWPRLRSSPADNAAITVTSPMGLWRLATDGADWNINRAHIYGLSISAVAAL